VTSALLDVRDLSVHFHHGDRVARAVDGVSLAVSPGETLGVVGESGSGKSMTALSIMGLVDPPGRIERQSEIHFDGVNLATMTDGELAVVRGRDIGMIFQEPMTSLNPVYTVGRQIGEALSAHTRLTARERRERSLELLQLVGIPAPERRLDDYPHQLSGGMLQRVMIAMAVGCGPRLLIADEPTTALDVTIQAQILELIAELRVRMGMALILITHDFGVVAQMATRVVVMYGGRVVETGPVEQIFRSPQHPYTVALMEAIPRRGVPRRSRLQAIEGTVPSAFDWPAGCRFAPRCRHAFGRCVHEEPTLIGDERKVACWLHRDLAGPGGDPQ
jgi:oligopeptide/dipeptide ABC transporter ATP-binding protein